MTEVAGEREIVPFEVEGATVVVEVLNGACWGTFRFVMLRDIEADGPKYPHRIGLIPHVDISTTSAKSKVGVALAAAELLDGTVLDAGAVVAVERMDPTLMVGEAVEDVRERPSGRKLYDRGGRRRKGKIDVDQSARPEYPAVRRLRFGSTRGRNEAHV